MTLSKELFLAIISMDAYNRGYGAGIAIEGDDASGGTTHIGGATISHNLEDADMVVPAQAAGFYAVAYTMGADAPEGLAGKTVISYRGTDNLGLRGGAVLGGAGLLRHLHPLHSPASFVT